MFTGRALDKNLHVKLALLIHENGSLNVGLLLLQNFPSIFLHFNAMIKPFFFCLLTNNKYPEIPELKDSPVLKIQNQTV